MEWRDEPRAREAWKAAATRREMVMWKGVEVGGMEGKSTLNTWLCWLGDGPGRGQDGEEDFQLTSGL